MQWDDVRVVLAAARAGQIKIAARQLHLSQATVGRRIARLEENLGLNLLIREPHGCRLSDEGLALLPQFEAVEAEFQTIADHSVAQSIGLQGTVRISMPDGFGLEFLSARIGKAHESYPDLKIQLVPAPRNFSLSQREADIAIRIERPSSGNIFRQKLTDYSLGLFASQGYIDRRGAPKTLEDLGSHRLIGYVEDLIETPELNYMYEFSKSWRSDIEVSSAAGQCRAVRSGAGVGILHHFMTHGVADLVPILPHITVTRSYWIAWHTQVAHLKRIKVITEFITQEVRAMPHSFWCQDNGPL